MANSARDPYLHASVRRETIDHPAHAAAHRGRVRGLPHAGGTEGRARGRRARRRVFAHLPGDAAARPARSTISLATASRARSAIRSPPTGSARARASTATSWLRRRSPAAAAGPSVRLHPMPDAGASCTRSPASSRQQAAHIRESELCATCHTLITEALGPDGRVIGSLPEQMNYQEWRHSAFDEEGRSCQSCHMPRGDRAGARRVGARGLPRRPVASHVPRRQRVHAPADERYRAELGVEATSAELEATARATVRSSNTTPPPSRSSARRCPDGTLAVDVAVTQPRPATSFRPAIRRGAPGCTSPCATGRDGCCSNRAG